MAAAVTGSTPVTDAAAFDRADNAADAAPQQVSVRVRADIIDRLVNETGEVSIARARIEGELRSLKGNLLELTGSVIRLRGQIREIEMQAETQIQSQMSHTPDAEGFDPLEFDRFTRFQELTRSLAEGVCHSRKAALRPGARPEFGAAQESRRCRRRADGAGATVA